MPLWEKLLEILQLNYPQKISFVELIEKSAHSQEQVQHTLQQLLQQGFPIRISGNQLSLSFPLLSKRAISQKIKTHHLAKKITLFDSIDSTNTYVKEHLATIKHGEVFLAYEQLKGKGRLGRAWSSPVGKSISMTLVLKPESQIQNASLITQLTAASVVKALEQTVDTKIKWPNDVLINNKKIAGILTEAAFSGGTLQGIIIGMGVNTNLEKEDFPDELLNKATSIRKETQMSIDPNQFLRAFFTQFEALYDDFIANNEPKTFLTTCRTHSALIGKNMWLIDGKKQRKVFIRTIDSAGGLVVQDLKTGQDETITSTHYSIRGEHSYV